MKRRLCVAIDEKIVTKIVEKKKKHKYRSLSQLIEEAIKEFLARL